MLCSAFNYVLFEDEAKVNLRPFLSAESLEANIGASEDILQDIQANM